MPAGSRELRSRRLLLNFGSAKRILLLQTCCAENAGSEGRQHREYWIHLRDPELAEPCGVWSCKRRIAVANADIGRSRSEEHTSELQSPDHLVCRLLLEKKKIRTA